jgi:hypothetical protein
VTDESNNLTRADGQTHSLECMNTAKILDNVNKLYDRFLLHPSFIHGRHHLRIDTTHGGPENPRREWPDGIDPNAKPSMGLSAQ